MALCYVSISSVRYAKIGCLNKQINLDRLLPDLTGYSLGLMGLNRIAGGLWWTRGYCGTISFSGVVLSKDDAITSCSKLSSKTSTWPSAQDLATSPTRNWATPPSGTCRPRWARSRQLVGPVCARTCVPASITENLTWLSSRTLIESDSERQKNNTRRNSIERRGKQEKVFLLPFISLKKNRNNTPFKRFRRVHK